MQNDKNRERLGEFFDHLQRHKWSYLFASAVLVIFLFSQIFKIQPDYTVKYWFQSDKKLIDQLETFEKNFGNQESIILIIDHPESIFNKPTLEIISRVTDDLLDIPNITSSRSIFNYNIVQGSEDEINVRPLYDEFDLEEKSFFPETLKSKIKIDKQLTNFLISKDEKTTLIYGFLRPSFEGGKTIDHIELVQNVKSLMASYDLKDVDVKLTGSSKFQEEFRKVSEKDLFVITPFMILMVVIFLFLSFKTLESIYIPIGLIFLCIGSAFGIGSLFGVRFENMVSAVPGILFSICIADSVHLLVTFYFNKKEGLNTYESMRNSFIKNFTPTLLTSLTTGVGFFSLLTSSLTPIKNLGILAGVGSIFAWFYTILVMPSLFIIMDRWSTFKISKDSSKKGNFNASPFVSYLNRFKYAFTFVFFLIVSSSLYLSSTNEVNSTPQEYLSEDVEVRRNTEYIREKFGGLTGPEIIFDSGEKDGIKNPKFLKAVSDYIEWIEKLSVVSNTVSVVESVKTMNKVLNDGDVNFYKIPDKRGTIAEIFLLQTMESNSSSSTLSDQFTADFRKLRLTISWTLRDSKSNVQMYEVLEEEAKKRNLNIEITGNSALGNQMNGFIVQTFIESMGLAIGLIFIILSILFKSIRLGFFSLIPNVMPVLLGTALMSILDHSIEAGAVMVCAVCLGISVDDTIHLMVNFLRKRKEGLSIFDSLEHTISHTGVALVVTTLILIVGFGVFMFADFIPNIRFGMYSAVVLFCALVIDLIFLPALLLLPYKSNAKEKIVSSPFSK